MRLIDRRLFYRRCCNNPTKSPAVSQFAGFREAGFQPALGKPGRLEACPTKLRHYPNSRSEVFIMRWLDEFKAFIQRGNVLDLAVAVIIGAAFGKIVTSLVGNILTPLLSILTPENAIAKLHFPVGGAQVQYGAFLQAVIDFFIVAFCVFLLVKAVNALNLQKVLAGEAKPAELTLQEKLLTEIRDLLKAKQEAGITKKEEPVGP
jgi:large conductance mechanosensitive channel